MRRTPRQYVHRLRSAILVCGLLGLARAAVLYLPFRWIDAWLKKPLSTYTRTDQRAKAITAYIKRSIELVAPRTPWQSNCLARALTARYLLRRERIASSLYLGVAHDDEGQLEAHAWLMWQQRPVTGAPGHTRFRVVAEYKDAEA